MSLSSFSKLREILKSSLDEQTHQRWNNFINGSLADMNKRNETNLVRIENLTKDVYMYNVYTVWQDILYVCIVGRLGHF